MAKKNLTPAERERIRQEAAQRRNAKENKQFWILVGITLIVALVMFLVPMFRNLSEYPGHIRNLNKVQASWVVHDLNPRTNFNKGTSNEDNAPNIRKPRYFHLASMNTPEGYVQEENFTFSSDDNDRDLHFTAKEPGGMLESVHVVGIPNKDAKKHATDVMQTLSANNMTSEIVEATINGIDLLYTVTCYPRSDAEAYTTLTLYLDTPQDACVIMMLSSYVLPTDQQPTTEALLAEAQTLLAGLTIID